MELSALIKELVETEKLAGTDLEAADWRTRPSLANMVAESKEKLLRLRSEYLQKVRQNTLGIFLVGDQARVAKFSEVATSEAGTLTVAADALYQRLTDRIEPSLGAGREFGPTQLQGLIQGLRDIGNELDIRQMRMPSLSDAQVLRTRADVLAYIRRLVRSVVNDDLLRIYVGRQVDEQAVKTRFAGNLLPVVVTGLEADEVAAVVALFTNSHTVEVGTADDGDVTKDTVLKQLKSVKSKINPKNPRTPEPLTPTKQ